jgi:predicted Zn-dependent protease
MFEKLAAQNKKKPGTFSKLFETHPQSIDRMEATRALVARFPDRDEYVLSTSEFQRVKNRLMRFSNSRVTTAGDLASGEDGGAPGRPTLKRRQPSTDDSASPLPDEQKDDKPAAPTLKRRQSDPNVTPPSNQPSINP